MHAESSSRTILDALRQLLLEIEGVAGMTADSLTDNVDVSFEALGLAVALEHLSERALELYASALSTGSIRRSSL